MSTGFAEGLLVEIGLVDESQLQLKVDLLQGKHLLFVLILSLTPYLLPEQFGPLLPLFLL